MIARICKKIFFKEVNDFLKSDFKKENIANLKELEE